MIVKTISTTRERTLKEESILLYYQHWGNEEQKMVVELVKRLNKMIYSLEEEIKTLKGIASDE